MPNWKSRVVVHYRSKNVVKGFVDDFNPWKGSFHISPQHVGRPTEVLLSEIKAVFFVRSFEGNRGRQPASQLFGFPHPGRQVEVVLSDRETLLGTIGQASCSPYGFYLLPADESDNNHLVFIPNHAVKSVRLLQVVTSDSFETLPHWPRVSERRALYMVG